jgi:hypothetical protein
MSAISIVTFTDLLTDYAEKLGETAINTSDSRKRKINNAYRYLCAEELWWWLESTGSATTASFAVTSITRSGTTATVTTTTNHSFNTGDLIAINGASQSEYNGSFFIVVTGVAAFTYSVSGSPATPATGTITASGCTYALPTDFRAFHPRNPVSVNDKWYFLTPFENLQQHRGSTGIVQLPQYRSQKAAYIYGTNITFVQTSMDDGLSIKYYYYKEPTMLDVGTDQPFVPLMFREAISLLAAGNDLVAQGGQEADMGKDYLSLYDQMVQKMRVEQDNRREMGIKRRTLDPDEVQVYGN